MLLEPEPFKRNYGVGLPSGGRRAVEDLIGAELSSCWSQSLLRGFSPLSGTLLAVESFRARRQAFKPRHLIEETP